jgi:hypothetical protein
MSRGLSIHSQLWKLGTRNNTVTNNTNKTASSFEELLVSENPSESKNYLTMSYTELNKLSYEEFQNHGDEIKANLKEKISNHKNEEDSNLKFTIFEKLHATNYTYSDNTNKGIFSALNQTTQHPVIFMSNLNNSVNNYLNGNAITTNYGVEMPSIDNPLTKEERSSINYASFLPEVLNEYQQLGNDYSQEVEMYSLLLNSINTSKYI